MDQARQREVDSDTHSKRQTDNGKQRQTDKMQRDKHQISNRGKQMSIDTDSGRQRWIDAQTQTDNDLEMRTDDYID